VPAPRHAGHYAGLPIPTPPGSNEKNVEDKPRFLRRLPKLGKGKLRNIVERRRTRLEMLLSVDEAVAAITTALQEENELDNTYLLFVSDNGYFNGEHRIRQGKYLPHAPSSHVPLLIRGPGIPAGGISEELVSNVDIAETIRQMTGASAALPQDGRSLLPFAQQPGLRTTRPILLEGDTGPGIDDDGGEGPAIEQADQRKLKRYRKRLKKKRRQLRRHCARLKRESPKRALLCFKRGVRNLEQEPTDASYNLAAPAYRALRSDRYMLSLYSNGALELYDMRRDPHQLRSVHKERRYRKVRKWMLAKLNTLAVCAGQACTAEIGPEPKLLKKNKKKGKRKGR
jgi:arylsulfatase A-like enzyme